VGCGAREAGGQWRGRWAHAKAGYRLHVFREDGLGRFCFQNALSVSHKEISARDAASEFDSTAWVPESLEHGVGIV
jgi:hypothetical protein